jgi:SAM-dependent methyltransferase
MRPDVTLLADYYATPAGCTLLAALMAQVQPLLRCRETDRLLGLGFAQPYLPISGPLVVQACPALQGVMRWPMDGANRSCLVDDKHLPFADSVFDQVMMVHALEYSEPARRLLREVWRVLAPGGQLLLLVPNRGRLFDRSPFANGKAFGGHQVQALLKDALFETHVSSTGVALPIRWLDRIMMRLFPNSGAVHIILAQKTDGAAPVLAGKQRRVKAAATVWRSAHRWRSRACGPPQ